MPPNPISISTSLTVPPHTDTHPAAPGTNTLSPSTLLFHWQKASRRVPQATNRNLKLPSKISHSSRPQLSPPLAPALPLKPPPLTGSRSILHMVHNQGIRCVRNTLPCMRTCTYARRKRVSPQASVQGVQGVLRHHTCARPPLTRPSHPSKGSTDVYPCRTDTNGIIHSDIKGCRT